MKQTRTSSMCWSAASASRVAALRSRQRQPVAAGSAAHCDWLEDLSFRFERSFFAGKAVIQPGTEGLVYTGNETVWPFRDLAVRVPRGHKVPVPGDTGAARLVVELLVRRAAELGVAVRYGTGVTGLVTGGGSVTGVRWRSATGSACRPASTPRRSALTTREPCAARIPASASTRTGSSRRTSRRSRLST